MKWKRRRGAGKESEKKNLAEEGTKEANAIRKFCSGKSRTK